MVFLYPYLMLPEWRSMPIKYSMFFLAIVIAIAIVIVIVKSSHSRLPHTCHPWLQR